MYVSRRVCLKNVVRVISSPSPFTSISSAAVCHNDGKQSACPANLGATLVPCTATYVDTNMRLFMPANLRFMSQIAQQSQMEEAMAMSVDVLQGSPNEYKDPLAWSHFTTEIPAAHAANLMINQILKCGKKSTARRILNGALKKIQEKTGKNPFTVLQEAIDAASPCVRVKRRRVGGTTYKVPNPIRSDQGKKVGIRWLVAAARKRPDRNMDAKLSEELIDAARGTGDAVRKKEESHRMAMTNRAFSHFR